MVIIIIIKKAIMEITMNNRKFFVAGDLIMPLLILITVSVFYHLLKTTYYFYTVIVLISAVLYLYNRNRMRCKNNIGMYEELMKDFLVRMKISSSENEEDMYQLFKDYSGKCINNRDEIKKLLDENNRNALGISLTMKDSVYQTSDITGSLKIISEKVDDLSASIEQSFAAVNQITQTVSAFSERIEDQSSAIIETSSSVEQMSSSITNINKVTTSKREKSALLLDLTGKGARQMETTNQIINGISSNIKSVRDVISVINDIASQTNLLAMNAAIEAAHAGEAGKGFSVVSDEIRKLAESTADNSRTISKNLQEIVDGVENVESSSKKSLEYFDEINTETSNFVDALEEIINTTRELDIGSNEIVTAISSLVNISEELKNGSGEMKLSAEEINNAILDIRDSGIKTKNSISRIADVTGNINNIFRNLTEVSIDSNKLFKKGSELLSSDNSSHEEIHTANIIMQHILWLIKVRSMIDDNLVLDAGEVGDHHSCYLGKWLDSAGFDNLRNTDAGNILESEHEKLHTKIKDIVSDKNNTGRDILEKQFAELLEISEVVVGKLVEIENS